MANKYANIISFFKKNIIEIPVEDNGDLAADDTIIYRNDEGAEDAGKITYIGPSLDPERIAKDFAVLRKATSHDLQKIEAHDERKSECITQCREQVAVLNLDMNIFDAAYSFDGKRLAFLFTADERVDFRELVKKLASIFKKQIHLHQVGPRDRARMIGGCGKCGKQICCKNWLHKLASITMDVVRLQGLEGKGGGKLAGICGKLLCCLRYEVEEYKKMREGLPLIGSIIQTKDGAANVIGLDVLNRKIKIVSEEGKFAIISDKDVKKIISAPEIRRMEEAAEEPATEESSGGLI
ncbi:hypothetical protein HZA39_04010 [Candidatus Peregrinibacteria bacterium]|nr:hypothetical protein [Candidatus Peregrinibacteria bacterium]